MRHLNEFVKVWEFPGKEIQCPKCNSKEIIKKEKLKENNALGCTNCNVNFVPKNDDWLQKAYVDYTIHKQTYSELKDKYNKSAPTLRKYFDDLGHAPFPAPTWLVDQKLLYVA